MRKITLFNANSQVRKEIMSSATTWGQLKSENSDFISGNVKGIVRETKVTLDNEEATLPTTEFTLFIATKEIKSGN
jgi:hypothetical protein